MAVYLRVPGAQELSEIVDCLLAGAEDCAPHAPQLAAKRRALADAIGDGLDQLPRPRPADAAPDASETRTDPHAH